jgi:hypothetical protein
MQREPPATPAATARVLAKLRCTFAKPQLPQQPSLPAKEPASGAMEPEEPTTSHITAPAPNAGHAQRLHTESSTQLAGAAVCLLLLQAHAAQKLWLAPDVCCLLKYVVELIVWKLASAAASEPRNCELGTCSCCLHSVPVSWTGGIRAAQATQEPAVDAFSGVQCFSNHAMSTTPR